MKYFCILLKSDKKRVKHVINHLLKNIPSLNIISAVDSKTNELEYYLGDRTIEPQYLSFCRRGQIACLLSHIEVWKKMIKDNIQEAVVFEDDAKIPEDFSDKLAKILEESQEFIYSDLEETLIQNSEEFIYLFVHPDSKKNKGEEHSAQLDKGYSTYGTVSYYITLPLAKKLVHLFAQRIFSTVDDSLSWYLQNHKINYYCVKENLVETAGQLYFHNSEVSTLGSNIGQAGLYKEASPQFTFFLDEEDYIVYPCCTTKDGNLKYETNLETLKCTNIYSSDGWIKSRITNNFKVAKCNLYVKKSFREKKEGILLTGAAGFIGSNTVFELFKEYPDYEIIIVDDLSNSNGDVIDKLKLFTDKLFFYKMDIKNCLDKIFTYHDIKHVIHFAAHKAVGESVSNPLKYYENNIGGLISLLKSMQKFSVKNLIFSSSATVYGNPESLPLTEKSKTSTLNPYGRTKLFAEEILRDMTNMNIICLRYFNPVGASLYGFFKEAPKGIPNNLFPYIISVIKGEREKINVFGKDYNTSDGTPIRDYIHVLDLGKGHISALKYLEKEKVKFEIFNLGTGKGYTVLEVIKRFAELLGKEIPYEIVGRREGDAPVVYADCSKARDILGWEATLSLDDMILSSF